MYVAKNGLFIQLIYLQFKPLMQCFSTFLLPRNPEQAWRSLTEPHALIPESSDVREVEATGCLRTHFSSRAELL